MVKYPASEFIWRTVFKTLAEMVRAGRPQKIAARQLRDFLCQNTSQLAPGREALLKTFNRRLARWQAGAQFDRRGENGSNEGELAKQIKALPWFIPAGKFFYLRTNRTYDTGSMPEAVMQTVSLPKVPTGWPDGIKKQLLETLGLAELPTCPPELRETILQRRRDYQRLVPETIARQIRVNKSIVKMFRSPRAWALDNLSAPGSQRRAFNMESGQREVMEPGDWFGGDDSTPGIAVCVPCKEIPTPCSQKFGVLLGRFQWLVYNDGRTDKILAYDYIVRPRGSYRAEDILNGMGAVMRTHGIPRVGWQFEGGNWNAKLVREAIRNSGCNQWRTYSPHQKAIESVFNRVWDRLALQFPHADMGRYRGENEANCRLYEACKAGHKDPRRFFPTLELVLAVFEEIVAEHNAKPIDSTQYGQWIPDNYFKSAIEAKPLKQFAPEMEWVLSPYAVERTVKGANVRCRVPLFESYSVPYEFSAPWLPNFSGRMVRLHFNPRQPHCAAKVVLLHNFGEHKAGDILGDAEQVGEGAARARSMLYWADDDPRAGLIARQKAANFVRRETRGIGAGGRVEYSRSEERNGIDRIGIIERGGVEKPVDDDKAQSRQRLSRNLGPVGPTPEIVPSRRERAAAAWAEMEKIERENKHLFA